jgi:hypothetical protein
VDPAGKERIPRVALELVFEDDPVPRREGNEDEVSEGGACMRGMGGRALGAGVSGSDGWIMGQ